MNDWLYHPYFGILLSIGAFVFGDFLQKKTKSYLVNPLLISIMVVVLMLSLFHIDLAAYQEGGSIISLLLGPATVALALPLYQQLHQLRQHFLPILVGMMIGTFTSLCFILCLSFILHLPSSLIPSILPKSLTTPIGMELSIQLEGNPSITVLSILVSGLIGSFCADVMFRIFHIHHPIAKGVALGTCAHAIGTAKAFQDHSLAGAMASLSIGLSGLFGMGIIPLFWKICKALFFS